MEFQQILLPIGLQLYRTYGEWLADPLPNFESPPPPTSSGTQYKASKSASTFAAQNMQGLILAPHSNLNDQTMFKDEVATFIEFRNKHEPTNPNAVLGEDAQRLPWLPRPKPEILTVTRPRNEMDVIVMTQKVVLFPFYDTMILGWRFKHPGLPPLVIPPNYGITITRLAWELLGEATAVDSTPRAPTPARLPGAGEPNVGAFVRLSGQADEAASGATSTPPAATPAPTPGSSSAAPGSLIKSPASQKRLAAIRADAVFVLSCLGTAPPAEPSKETRGAAKSQETAKFQQTAEKEWLEYDTLWTQETLNKLFPAAPIEFKKPFSLCKEFFEFLVLNKIPINSPADEHKITIILPETMQANLEWVRAGATQLQEYLKQAANYSVRYRHGRILLDDYVSLVAIKFTLTVLPSGEVTLDGPILWQHIDTRKVRGGITAGKGKPQTLSAKELIMCLNLGSIYRILQLMREAGSASQQGENPAQSAGTASTAKGDQEARSSTSRAAKPTTRQQSRSLRSGGAPGSQGGSVPPDSDGDDE